MTLQLLRVGGIISIDNTLWSGRVLQPLEEVNREDDTHFLQALNEKISKDGERVQATQINIGDGLTIVVKK